MDLPPLVATGLTPVTVVAVGVALWIRVGHLERTTTAEITRLRDRVHDLSNDVATLQGTVQAFEGLGDKVIAALVNNLKGRRS